MIEHQGHMIETDPNSVSEPADQRRTLQEQRASIAEMAASPTGLVVVAVLGDDAQRAATHEPGDGMLLGALAFHGGNRRKVRHHGHFGLSVHADWRGKGVGSALITTVLDWGAGHEEIEKVCLGVFETNVGARRLYERLGFVQESRTPMHFKLGPGRYVDDLWMVIYVKPGIAPQGFRTWGG